MEQYFRYVLEFAVVLPSALFALLPTRRCLRFSAGAVFAAAGATTAALVLLGPLLCMQNDWSSSWVVLSFLPLFFLLYSFTVELSLPKKLFCFASGIMLGGFCFMYTRFLTAPLESDTGPSTLTSGAVCLALTLVIGAAFWQILTSKLPYLFEEERLEQGWRYFTIIPLALAVLDYWTTPVHPSNVMVGRVRVLALIIMLLVPTVFFAFCNLLWWLTKQLTKSAQLREENRLLQMEEKRYGELRHYMDETRALRHDFRQHLAVIDELHRTGKTQQLTDYLRQLHVTVAGEHKHYCRNYAVDALAAHYDERAAAQGTTIEWKLDLPETLPLSDTEYCAMLGNLVENALRAVAALPPEKRRVRAGSMMTPGAGLGLYVENPYAGEIELGRDGLPKAKAAGHGIGLASVAATVERSHGTFAVGAENGIFSVNAMLYPGKDRLPNDDENG